MLLDPLSDRLRRLFGTRPIARDRAADAARRDALEQRLMVEHQRRYGRQTPPANRATRWPGLTLAARLAIASVALTAAGVAACQIPVDVELELGRRLVFEVPADDQAEQRIEAVARALEDRTGADQIELRVQHSGGETMVATLDMWGEALDLDAIAKVFSEHGIAVEAIEERPLEGTVRSTWGHTLGHKFFNLDHGIDTMDVVEARQRILDNLAAQGFEGDAEVYVDDDDDGHRRVEIRLRTPDDGAVRHTPRDSP